MRCRFAKHFREFATKVDHAFPLQNHHPARAGEEDYDDLPAEPDVPAIPAKKHRQKAGSTTKDSVVGADITTREFEDYDDPIRQLSPLMEKSRALKTRLKS